MGSFFKHNFAYLAILLLFAVLAYQKTSNDWDLLAYTACVFHLESNDSNRIHAATYHMAEQYFSPNEFSEMISKNEYRIRMYADVKSFFGELHFYYIKPLYIGLIYSISKLNQSPLEAMKWINSFSYLGIGCILLLIINLLTNKIIPSFLVFTALISYNGLLDMVRELTPDVLSMFVLLALSYGYLFSIKRKWVILFSILAILIRPDNILFVSIVWLLTEYFGNKFNYRTVFVGSLFILIHIIIKYMTKGADYEQTTLSIFTYPLDLESIRTLKSYLQEIASNIDNLIPFFSLLILTIWTQNDLKSKESLLLISILIALTIRFLFIPHLSERFYIPYGYMAVIAILSNTEKIKKILEIK